MVSEISTHGERFILAAPGTILTAAKSQPGNWYQTTVSSCTCKGAQFRGNCRHQKALRDIAAEAIAATVTVDEQAARKARIAAFNDEAWGR